MNRYIVLLRGVNVGGNNTIPMPMLKAAFQEAGFLAVRTYINSGNILFSTAHSDPLALQAQCRRIILDTFHLDIVTAVIPAMALIEAIHHAPDWWDGEKDSKHNAIFVIPPASAASIMAAVGEAKPEYERVDSFGPVIFWSAPIKTFSHTRWSKVVSTKALYQNITIRNANTAKKLAQLAQEE